VIQDANYRAKHRCQKQAAAGEMSACPDTGFGDDEPKHRPYQIAEAIRAVQRRHDGSAVNTLNIDAVCVHSDVHCADAHPEQGQDCREDCERVGEGNKRKNGAKSKSEPDRGGLVSVPGTKRAGNWEADECAHTCAKQCQAKLSVG